jgi:hypothetical protein
MSDATRRTFLAAAGTGAAAAAAVAAAPGAVGAASRGAVAETGAQPATTGDRLVAYVADPRSGRVTVMYGEDEVTVHDADLVRRLAGIARR